MLKADATHVTDRPPQRRRTVGGEHDDAVHEQTHPDVTSEVGRRPGGRRATLQRGVGHGGHDARGGRQHHETASIPHRTPPE